MVKPSANNSQVLVWRPKNGKSVCVVPAKESFKESNPITIFKGGNTMARKPHMIRQLTEEVGLAQILTNPETNLVFMIFERR